MVAKETKEDGEEIWHEKNREKCQRENWEKVEFQLKFVLNFDDWIENVGDDAKDT